MKTENVKCHEKVGNEKKFVGEEPLKIAEDLEDIIAMTESGECTEVDVVKHFNASRRIELQRVIKAKAEGKGEKKALVEKANKLFAAAASNPELAAKLREMGLMD